ncbi:MAG: hypothetical protein ACKVXR_15485 [Planctomycetota bacterium]
MIQAAITTTGSQEDLPLILQAIQPMIGKMMKPPTFAAATSRKDPLVEVGVINETTSTTNQNEGL